MQTVTLQPGGPSAAVPARAYVTLAFTTSAPARPPRRWALDGVTTVTIGRGPVLRAEPAGGELAITIDDGTLSRPHLRLHHDGEWRVRDAGSKNGTWLDGERVDEAALADGSVLFIGKCVLVFRHLAVEQPDERDPPDPALPAALHTAHPGLEASFARLRRAAGERLPILVRGETGTGKELMARAIHELSRRTGPMLAVNCGSLTPSLLASELFGVRAGAFTGATADRPGLFRAAHGGTLLLDEIGDMPADGQVALLRVLQEREVTPLGETTPVRVDTRVIAATHRDLDALVAAGTFREDLYARLAAVAVTLPPVRERREDLGRFIARALADNPGHPGIAVDAARLVFSARWPRNVRQLLQTLGVALADRDQPLSAARLAEVDADLDGAPAEPGDETVSAARLAELLRAHAGNISAVARALSTSRTQVVRLMNRHGVR